MNFLQTQKRALISTLSFFSDIYKSPIQQLYPSSFYLPIWDILLFERLTSFKFAKPSRPYYKAKKWSIIAWTKELCPGNSCLRVFANWNVTMFYGDSMPNYKPITSIHSIILSLSQRTSSNCNIDKLLIFEIALSYK